MRGSLDGAALRLGVACSRFNGQITTRLLTGARRQLALRGVVETSTTIAWVPGVFELPLAARALSLHGAVDAVVCLGAAIRGETSHHDFVAGAVANACQQVQLECGVPVAFGVVTTDDLQQALELSGGRYGNRGAEAVDTAIEMASLLRALNPRQVRAAGRAGSARREPAPSEPPLGGSGPGGPR
ncbi:MAG: ribH [Acidimicrobiaceae bacterium]|nr:ribH [Acidimicrobiaceae bacterium]